MSVGDWGRVARKSNGGSSREGGVEIAGASFGGEVRTGELSQGFAHELGASMVVWRPGGVGAVGVDVGESGKACGTWRCC